MNLETNHIFFSQEPSLYFEVTTKLIKHFLNYYFILDLNVWKPWNLIFLIVNPEFKMSFTFIVAAEWRQYSHMPCLSFAFDSHSLSYFKSKSQQTVKSYNLKETVYIKIWFIFLFDHILLLSWCHNRSGCGCSLYLVSFLHTLTPSQSPRL